MKDTTRIKKSGNNIGIFESLESKEEDEVSLSIEENSMKITPGKKETRKSMKEIFEGYIGDYKCEELDLIPVGKEISGSCQGI